MGSDETRTASRPAAGLTVREATPGDYPAMRALLTSAALPIDGLDDVARAWVAVAASEIVGTVALEHHGDADTSVFLLRSAAVSPSHRGHGIGTALTTAAVAYVDAAGAPAALLTETAAGFFPAFGFRPVARDELPDALSASPELRGACPATAVALLRPRRSDYGVAVP